MHFNSFQKLNYKFRCPGSTLLLVIAMATGITHGCKIPKSQLPGASAPTTLSTPAPAVLPLPEENRFVKTILSNDLNEPMELAVAPDGRVFFVERSGSFYVFDPATNKTRLIHRFALPEKAINLSLDGLLGLALDPDFAQNRFVYFVYTSQVQGNYRQNVARFRLLDNNTLDPASEKILLHFPVFVVGRTHTGGSLAFDKNRHLYISTGDDVLPSQSQGFAPLDQRPGRAHFDAAGTAGNALDLRGKILRIHPESDGTYTIPAGNLFAPGTPGTRPEIYVMGCRNPFRISVDPVTSTVFWGEVGPDAGTNEALGPRGYDEMNRARAAGNFGWPFFVADNQAYRQYDFATKTAGDLFDAAGPVNTSVNNTGRQKLPPAQKALIWYPYEASPEFPGLGQGGRCAMSGPVYHFEATLASARKLPEYYDGAWFVYDWMRNWVFAVRLDPNQDFVRMEPFMPATGNFIRPMDLELGPDGALYMLEYGSVYSADNDDARLVRIDYNPGNRAPAAKISVSDTLGLAPLKVAFSGKSSSDPDADDRLLYEWQFGNGQTSREVNPTFVYEMNGIFKAVLKVTDAGGKSTRDSVAIRVGNTSPQVSLRSSANPSFYFAGQTHFPYAVQVRDREDGSIDLKKVRVRLQYLPTPGPVLSGPDNGEPFAAGKALLAGSDCQACHTLNKKAVGPAFLAVSQKYQGDKGAVGRLADKVITGGSGVWGQNAMNAHPQLSKEEATDIIRYVLSLSEQQTQVSLPATGRAPLQQHLGASSPGRYLLAADYTDRGGAITPLTGRDQVFLRPARQQAEEAEILSGTSKKGIWMELAGKQSYFGLRRISLQGLTQLTIRYAAKASGALEVRLDSVTGPVLTEVNLPATGSTGKYAEATAVFRDPGGFHTIFFVVGKKEMAAEPVCRLDWIEFKK